MALWTACVSFVIAVIQRAERLVTGRKSPGWRSRWSWRSFPGERWTSPTREIAEVLIDAAYGTVSLHIAEFPSGTSSSGETRITPDLAMVTRGSRRLSTG